MKRSGLPSKIKSSSRQQQSIDMDPYSTSIIDELLSSTADWRNQDQIVKLTFQAFKDFINLHTNEIKDLKSLLTTRASKQELSTALTLKANVSDFTKIIDEISQSLDSKIAYADMNAMLGQFARKKQLNEILMLSSIKNEAESIKSKGIEKNLQIKILEARFEDFQKQLCKKIGGCVTLQQFQELTKIVEHKVNVAQLNDVLENRVTKQYLSTCLQKKLSKSDLESALAKKADVNDLELIINSLEMKASVPTIEKLTQILQNKADKSDLMILSNEKKNQHDDTMQKLSNFKSHVQLRISSLQKQIETNCHILTQGLKAMEKDHQNSSRNLITSNQLRLTASQLKNELSQQIGKIKHEVDEIAKNAANNLNYENFKRELMSEINLRKICEEKIYEEIDDVRKRIEEVSAKKLQKTEYFNFKSELAEQLDQKIETEHVQQAFNKWEVEITQKTEEDKQEVLQLIRKLQQTLAESIAQNAKEISVMASKAQRLDQSVVEEIVRKNRKQIDECRKTVDSIYTQLRSKLHISEYESDLLEIRKKFDLLERQSSLKANIKDVCVLADSKPNIEDVNKALKEVKTALDSKTCQVDLQEVVKDQASINETLLCQNIIGRWLWQSGQLRAGGLIPWEVQFANTVPDYYFWEKDKSSILVLVGGIYQITSCLFGRNSIPNIIINGDPINIRDLENSNSSNETKKCPKKKKDKQSIGHTICEYVLLPARSRVSVTAPLEGAEGFLNIKRL